MNHFCDIVTAADDEFPAAITAAMWTILDILNSTRTLQVLNNAVHVIVTQISYEKPLSEPNNSVV